MKFQVDSRKITDGQIFVAIKGHTVDGHDYIDDAIKNGASKIIAEHEVKCSVPVEVVPSTLEYLKVELKKEYADKWGMDESIFPESITDNMDVLDYKMVYYNPWDAQYLSYLVVEYDDKSYEEEIQRLEQYDSKEYKGYFGTRGFRDKYRLLAIEVDPYYGLIYALGEENNQIIYMELIFCNYFYDIDYQNEIDIQYLPIGFDATPDNEYRQKRLNP